MRRSLWVIRGGSLGVVTTLLILTAALAGAQQPPAARALAAAPTSFTLEIEDLAGKVSVQGGDVVVQPMAGFGPGWGGDAQLFWRAAGPGPTLTWELQIPAAGAWDLALQYTTAPDYARFAVQIDGRQVAEVDGYGAAVGRARKELGRYELAAGAHTVTIALTGRHGASSGWIVGLDRLEGVRGPAAPPAAMAATRAANQARVFALGQPRIDPEALAPLAPQIVQLRLEIRSWGVAGRRGVEERWEPRRIRLEWGQPDLRVRLRWQAPGGAAKAQWQVFTELPPPAGKGQPLATGELAGVGPEAWQEFELDLKQFAPPDLPDLPWAGLRAPDKARPRLLLQVQPVTATRRGPPAAASNLVEVKFSNQPMGKLKVPRSRLEIALVDARPVRPYDQRFLCWAVATSDGPPKGMFDPNHPKDPMWRRGDKRGDLCDHDDSGGVLGFFEDFGAALGGAVMAFVDTIGSAVDQASALYSEVKGGVLDLAAAPLRSLGCGTPCDGALALALDAALVSVGVPPSLPDFAQVVQGLEDGGIDAVTEALMETAVSQGIPADQVPGAREAARAAVAHLVDQAKQEVSSGGGSGGSGGWAPDLSRAYSPAVLVFEIRNRGTARSEPTFLQLLNEEPARAEVPLALWQKLPVGGYEPSWTLVPALERGTSTRVAVTLRPETDPHLWLELYYGRSSLLPPQEFCHRDFQGAPDKIAACQARMKVRSDLMYSTSFELNRTWDAVYAKSASRFTLKLFRFGDNGAEGIEATLTCDAGGPCRMTGGATS